MTTRLRQALEISDVSATLYLSGVLSAADAFPMRRVCAEIPDRVTTLRLDLHGVTRLEEGAMDAVRAVVRYWRETRRGSFRLSFASEHIVATICEGDVTPARVLRAEVPMSYTASGSAALMGTFI